MEKGRFGILTMSLGTLVVFGLLGVFGLIHAAVTHQLYGVVFALFDVWIIRWFWNNTLGGQ